MTTTTYLITEQDFCEEIEWEGQFLRHESQSPLSFFGNKVSIVKIKSSARHGHGCSDTLHGRREGGAYGF